MAKRGIYQVEIFESWCKHCGICVAFCPEEVLEMDAVNKPCITRPENCIGCGLCEIRCPDFAISVKIKNQQSKTAAKSEEEATSQEVKDDEPASEPKIDNTDLKNRAEDSAQPKTDSSPA